MKGPWVGPFVRVLACALLFVLMEVTPVASFLLHTDLISETILMHAPTRATGCEMIR